MIWDICTSIARLTKQPKLVSDISSKSVPFVPSRGDASKRCQNTFQIERSIWKVFLKKKDSVLVFWERVEFDKSLDTCQVDLCRVFASTFNRPVTACQVDLLSQLVKWHPQKHQQKLSDQPQTLSGGPGGVIFVKKMTFLTFCSRSWPWHSVGPTECQKCHFFAFYSQCFSKSLTFFLFPTNFFYPNLLFLDDDCFHYYKN